MLTVLCDLAIVLATAATCPPALHDMPILITYYDPATCYVDGQVVPNGNCNSDPAHFADATPVLPESYGRVAACIPAWLGVTVVIDGIGSWRCRDAGTAVQVTWRRGQWVIVVDVLAHEEPYYNYWLFEDWELRWR